jgi:hypothetical protein
MPGIKNTVARRLNRWQKSGKIYTRKIKQTKKKAKYMECLMGKCARRLYDYHFQDDLKAPVNNDAGAAKLAPAAFNFYYGANMAKTKDPKTVNRAAYAFGSGATSIGLDPRTMRLRPFFSDLLDLMRRLEKLIRKDPHWDKALGKNALNSCAAKAYYWTKNEAGKNVRKAVNYHVDVNRNAAGIPDKNNSQIPDTPVVMVSFGDEKCFTMRRHISPTVSLPDSHVEFRQTSGTILVLDGRDEQVRDGVHWRHMSRAGDNHGDVTFSFMFRAVQMEKEVHVSDGTLVDHSCGKRKMMQFKKAGNKPFQKAHYKQTCTAIDENMMSMFSRFP